MKKHLFIYTLFLLLTTISCGSEVEKTEKLSPYADSKLKINDAKLEVKYSSPQKRDRKLWGELVPYNSVWRTGADEATVFETTAPLLIGTDTLPAGKYSFFTIPTANEWTGIFNTTWEQWGAFNYDATKDQLRVKISTSTDATKNTEGMLLELQKQNDTTAQLHFEWGKLYWDLPIQVLPKESK